MLLNGFGIYFSNGFKVFIISSRKFTSAIFLPVIERDR